MVEERRVTPKDAAALAQRLKEAFASSEDRVVIHWMDQSIQLERASQVEFLVRHPSAGSAGRVILGADAKPTSYPGNLPYVPHEIVMLNEPIPPMMATWWSTADPSTLYSELDRQCLDTGWERQDDPPAIDAEVTRRMYSKDGSLRYLMMSQGIVTLVERDS
jgi:hypothetical protein